MNASKTKVVVDSLELSYDDDAREGSDKYNEKAPKSDFDDVGHNKPWLEYDQTKEDSEGGCPGQELDASYIKHVSRSELSPR